MWPWHSQQHGNRSETDTNAAIAGEQLRAQSRIASQGGEMSSRGVQYWIVTAGCSKEWIFSTLIT